MDLRLEPVLSYGLADTARLLNQGFEDYFVPIKLDDSTVLHIIRHDSVDVASSQVILRNGRAVGAALVARRGWTSRLAGMAIVAEARGQGLGRWCMDQLLGQARARGERTMVLEVIEQNTAAAQLYRSCGFRVRRRLVSYAASPTERITVPDLEEVDMRELARWVTAHGLPDLPWQISGESLAQAGPPDRAYRLHRAYLAVSDPAQAQIVIRSLVVEPEARRRGQALELLRAGMARHPDKTWRIPALCPIEIGGLFEKAGFVKESLAQLQMMLDLD